MIALDVPWVSRADSGYNMSDVPRTVYNTHALELISSNLTTLDNNTDKLVYEGLLRSQWFIFCFKL